jgi:hypothetical protein
MRTQTISVATRMQRVTGVRAGAIRLVAKRMGVVDHEANLARLAPVFGEWVRRHLMPLREQVELLDREITLAPGVNVLRRPGTPKGMWP